MPTGSHEFRFSKRRGRDSVTQPGRLAGRWQKQVLVIVGDIDGNLGTVWRCVAKRDRIAVVKQHTHLVCGKCA